VGVGLPIAPMIHRLDYPKILITPPGQWIFSVIPQPLVNGQSHMSFRALDCYGLSSNVGDVPIKVWPVNHPPYFQATVDELETSISSVNESLNRPYYFDFTTLSDPDSNLDMKMIVASYGSFVYSLQYSRNPLFYYQHYMPGPSP